MARPENNPSQAITEEVLVVTHVYDAPRNLVFQAWTEPERVKQWWGPKEFTAPFCKIDFRVGGSYLFCMRSPDGKDYWSQGVYRAIKKPERIVSTDTFADSEGHPVPPERYGMSPDWPEEAIIDVAFTEHAGKTRVTVRHSPLPQGRDRDMCRQGWDETLVRLGDYLAQETRSRTRQDTMEAVALNEFGGVEKMRLQTLPIPEVGPGEVLIRIQSAGVGVWDPFEREGGFARMLGVKPMFPYILGSECAGTIERVADDVKPFKEGDRVYAFTLSNPKGGSYAEHTVVRAENVSLVPGGIPTIEAGAMPVDAMTALQGLDQTLALQRGESLMIFGASGGIGHMAIQLAKRMGARVLAVASGTDGVSLAEELGADRAVDGRKDNVVVAARRFAPEGIDAALITTGGESTQMALEAIRKGGRIAYPNGVEPEPKAPSGVSIRSYDGMPTPETIQKLNRLIEPGRFIVHIARTFSLDQAATAHRALESHYLGKLVLRIG
jgi:NADPH:quinone reductase